MEEPDVKEPDVKEPDVKPERPSFRIQGSIQGLNAEGLKLENNRGDMLVVTASATTFAFSRKLQEGDVYKVTVAQQPQGLGCVPKQRAGVVRNANIAGIVVECTSVQDIELQKHTISPAEDTVLSHEAHVRFTLTGSNLEGLSASFEGTACTVTTESTSRVLIACTLPSAGQHKGQHGHLLLSNTAGTLLRSFRYKLGATATAVTASIPPAQVTNTSFVLNLNGAVLGMQVEDVTLTPHVGVVALAGNADGTQYIVRTNAMVAGTAYSVTLHRSGYSFDALSIQGVALPDTAVDVSATISDVTSAGFTLAITQAVPLTLYNLSLTSSLAIHSLDADTAMPGRRYTVKTALFTRDIEYTLGLISPGFRFSNSPTVQRT